MCLIFALFCRILRQFWTSELPKIRIFIESTRDTEYSAISALTFSSSSWFDLDFSSKSEHFRLYHSSASSLFLAAITSYSFRISARISVMSGDTPSTSTDIPCSEIWFWKWRLKKKRVNSDLQIFDFFCSNSSCIIEFFLDRFDLSL